MQQTFQHLPDKSPGNIVYPRMVPYYAQVADREHIADYLDSGKDLILDPYWQSTGAKTPEEYAYWALRSCGIAAFKSCIEAFHGTVHSIQEWINIALAADGYLIETDDEGISHEIGWKHQSLAQLCHEEGISAIPQSANLDDILHALHLGQLVIASVSFEIGTHRPITRRGGHLVTITGMNVSNGDVESVILHNPSGRGLALQEHAVIPVARFLPAFSGRVIFVGGKTNPNL